MTGEAVVGQRKDPEAGEPAELRRDWTGDDSGIENELSQLTEVGDGGRQRACESGRVGEAGAESESGDSAEGGAGNAGECGAGIRCGEVPRGEETGAGMCGRDVGERVLDGNEGAEIDGADSLLKRRKSESKEKENEKK